MDWRERPALLIAQRVRHGGVRFRRSPVRDDDEGGDESWFFLVAVIAGGVLGYLVALG